MDQQGVRGAAGHESEEGAHTWFGTTRPSQRRHRECDCERERCQAPTGAVGSIYHGGGMFSAELRRTRLSRSERKLRENFGQGSVRLSRFITRASPTFDLPGHGSDLARALSATLIQSHHPPRANSSPALRGRDRNKHKIHRALHINRNFYIYLTGQTMHAGESGGRLHRGGSRRRGRRIGRLLLREGLFLELHRSSDSQRDRTAAAKPHFETRTFRSASSLSL